MSSGAPLSMEAAARSSAPAARLAQAMARGPVIRFSPSSATPARSRISRRSSSIPSPVRAETHMSAPSASPPSARSDLLRTTTQRSSTSSSSALSSSVSGCEPSSTMSTTSAFFCAERARSTPIFSTLSSVSRCPAVSLRSMRAPSMVTVSVSTSRVVPGRSVTMARSLPVSALRSDDLPTLGRPARTTLSPSRTILAAFSSEPALSRPAISSASEATLRAAAGSSISSGKSFDASMSARRSLSLFRQPPIKRDTPPSISRTEARSAASPPAVTTRMTASAWLRSMRPFMNARFVNSPGSAGDAPSASTR